MDSLIFSNNPMTNGCECIVCVIAEKDSEDQINEMHNVFRPGQVVAVTDEKNLPVYPDLDALVQDTIEATFNPDIDRTCHFDLGDIEDLYLFRATLLGDATSTAIKSVFTAKAILIGEPYDMVPIRTEIRLKAAKYGKKLIEGQKSARELQKEEELKDIDYNGIMDKFDLGSMLGGAFGGDNNNSNLDIGFADDFSVNFDPPINDGDEDDNPDIIDAE